MVLKIRNLPLDVESLKKISNNQYEGPVSKKKRISMGEIEQTVTRQDFPLKDYKVRKNTFKSQNTKTSQTQTANPPRLLTKQPNLPLRAKLVFESK